MWQGKSKSLPTIHAVGETPTNTAPKPAQPLEQNVEVKLELGHKAALRSKITSEGYTHDWTLFVRGPDGCNIQHFVEKVVFHLHESFPKPKRLLKDPPYHVSESGYAGFNLAIEVHFRNKEDPKKVRFEYDLYLHLEGPPIQNSRLEKLTFQNPNSEFRRKLLKGGGVAVSGGSQSTNSSSSNPVQTETEHPPRPKPIKGSNEVPKKTPKTKLPHEIKEAPPKAPELPRHPFTDIFGTPIKTKPSPDTSHKSKENAKEKTNISSSKSNSSSTALSSSNSNKPSKEVHKITSSSKEKPPKTISKEIEKKESKSNNLKRSSSPPPPSSQHSQSHKIEDVTAKKRRRSTSTSSATSSVTEKNITSKEKKKKSKDKEHKKEPKVAAALPHVITPSKKETPKQTKPQHVAPRKEPRELISPASAGHNEDQDSVASSGRARLESESSDVTSRSHEEKEIIKPEDGESRDSMGGASSPSSSLSLSSLPPGSAHGPLATMIAQMEQELLSPLSSDQASPVRPVTLEEDVKLETAFSPPPPPPPPEPPVSEKHEDKLLVKKVKEKRRSEKTVPNSKRAKEENESCLPPPLPPQSKTNGKQQQPIDAAYLGELMQLQERIMALRDKQHLQRIVDVIEETGLYQITSSTIDFDLCALDRSTVQKLQNCMAVT